MNVSFQIEDATWTRVFGPYEILPSGGATTWVYESEAGIFSDDEMNTEDDALTDTDRLCDLSALPAVLLNQDVVIVKGDGESVYDVYGIRDSLGDIVLRLTIDGVELCFNHTLTADAEFAEWIDCATEWVNTPLVFLPAEPPDITSVALAGSAASANSVSTLSSSIQRRGIIARALIPVFKVYVNPPFSLVKGVFDGVRAGLEDDCAGIAGMARFLCSPYKRGSEFFKALWQMRLSHFGEMIDNGLVSLMHSADQSVRWELDSKDWSDNLTAQCYVTGYVFGYGIEQVATMMLGNFFVGKAGKVVASLMVHCKAGKIMLAGVKAAQKCKMSILRFGAQTIKKTGTAAAELTRLRKLANALCNIPLPGGSKVAEVLGERYGQWLGKINAARTAINGAWDTAGEKLFTDLADVTQKLGTKVTDRLSHKAVKGFCPLFERLYLASTGTSRIDDFLRLVTKADGTLPKSVLDGTLEAFDGLTGSRPEFFVKGIDEVHERAYRYVNSWDWFDNIDGQRRIPTHDADGW